MHAPTRAERIRGSLIGLAIGDELGARFEGATARELRRRYPTPANMLERLPGRTLHYTDDAESIAGAVLLGGDCGSIAVMVGTWVAPSTGKVRAMAGG